MFNVDICTRGKRNAWNVSFPSVCTDSWIIQSRIGLGMPPPACTQERSQERVRTRRRPNNANWYELLLGLNEMYMRIQAFEADVLSTPGGVGIERRATMCRVWSKGAQHMSPAVRTQLAGGCMINAQDPNDPTHFAQCGSDCGDEATLTDIVIADMTHQTTTTATK